MLRLHLGQVNATDATTAELDEEIERLLEPFREELTLLKTIPGVSDQVARTLLAEIGADMNQFPTAAQLVSWAGLCPRLNESAGKRRGTRVRKGAPWLKPVLVQGAWSATNKKNSYLRAQYYRLKARRGPKKAIIAVAASILTSAYYILRYRIPYRDLTPQHFDSREKHKVANRLLRRLADLGYAVEIKATAA